MAESDETEAPVIHGAVATASMRTETLDEHEARERGNVQKGKLLALGRRGYRTFLATDIDERYNPRSLSRPSGARGLVEALDHPLQSLVELVEHQLVLLEWKP